MLFDIDLDQVYSADDLHDLLEEKLPLPDYYGRNLDALHDVLTEGHIWEIHFHHTAEAASALGKYMKSFRRMCAQAEEENEKLTVSFE